MKTLLAVLLVLAVTAGPAAAQNCSIGVYFEPNASQYDYFPTPLELESFWVVMFLDDTAGAAAYSLDIDGAGVGGELFIQARFSGPSGDGLVLDQEGGTSVALGECAVGFGGFPVVVDEYQYVVLPGFCCAQLSIGPNTTIDPDLPQYVSCTNVQKDCQIGPALYLGHPDPVEDRSFGAVKSLFGGR